MERQSQKIVGKIQKTIRTRKQMHNSKTTENQGNGEK